MQIIKIDNRLRMGGFTMIEIMFTVTILIILAALAAPSFGTNIKNNRLISRSNDLVSAINIARQSAVSRGQVVFVCHTVSAGSATPSCGGTGSGWQSGFLVYAAPFNTQIASNRDYIDGSDTLIKKVDLDTRSTGLTVTPSGNVANHIAFRGNGLIFGATGDITMLVCDDRTGDFGNQLNVSATGRIYTESKQTCS